MSLPTVLRQAPLVAALVLAGGQAHAAADSLNLFTEGEGLQALNLQELADASGYDTAQIDTWLRGGTYALRSGGTPRAWHYDAAAGILYFAAERHETEHTARNAYRLYRGATDARPMWVVQGGGPATGSPGVFGERLVLEEDRVYAPWSSRDPDGRYWFWDYVYAGTSKDRLRLPLALPDPVAGGCGIQPRLRVHLQGSSDLSTDVDHQVLGILNPDGNGPSARIAFDAFNAQVLNIPFSSDALAASGNELELVSEPRPGVSKALQRLDRIEVEYCRQMRAEDGQLWVRQAGPGVVTVAGLPGLEIAVIQDPGQPTAVWRKDLTVAPDGAEGYQVSFDAPATADYLIAHLGAAHTPATEVDDPSDLTSAANAADYLIIAPKAEMQAAAEALAAHRAADGLIVKIAWLQDVYDEFSLGRTSPLAIRTFLETALTWNRVPTYVVFLGRGTLNHKGRPDHFPGESLIPVRMASGPWGLFPSDNRYCDTNGDGIPELACGRIPAETDVEALAYVEKLAAYESATIADWMDLMIGVADDADPVSGDFPGDAAVSEALVSSLGYSVKARHFTGAGLTQFKDALKAAWNQGAALSAYWGHGGYDRWGAENFLPLADIAGLSNAPRLPIAAGLTCYAGNDSYPGFAALAAAMVVNPDGGAIATWMPTHQSLNAGAVTLGDHFLELLAGDKLTVGEAAAEAKARALVDDVPAWELDLFEVAGDPAVRLP